MLVYLQFLEPVIGPLRLFQFISVRSVLAGLLALLFGFVLGPKLISALKRIGAKQAFRNKSEVGELADLHESKAKTPTMGGLLNIWVRTFLHTSMCRFKCLCSYSFGSLWSYLR